MRRLWKHIQWLHRAEAVGRVKVAEDMQIACQGCWFARHIHNSGHGMLYQRIENHLLTTSAWWIDHKAVDARGKRRQYGLDLALENLHIGDITKIPLRILDSARRFFNSNHLVDVMGEQQCEGAHPTVGIN